MISKRSLDLARIIFEAEPDAALGDPAAVERTEMALAKVTGAILSGVLVRQGDEAFAAALGRVTQAIEQEARDAASMAVALMDGHDKPDALH